MFDFRILLVIIFLGFLSGIFFNLKNEYKLASIFFIAFVISLLADYVFKDFGELKNTFNIGFEGSSSTFSYAGTFRYWMFSLGFGYSIGVFLRLFKNKKNRIENDAT